MGSQNEKRSAHVVRAVKVRLNKQSRLTNTKFTETPQLKLGPRRIVYRLTIPNRLCIHMWVPQGIPKLGCSL